MRKTRKFLTLSLFLCCSLMFTAVGEVSAAEPSGEQTVAESGMTDENAQRLTEVTGMDSTGEIFEVDGSSGEVETSGFSFFARIASPKIVNFRTKVGETTDYTVDATGASGYTYGAYGADAAYLGTSNGKVKFMLSGVVGWVAESDVQVLNLSDAQSYSCYKVSGGKLLHYVTQDMTTPGHATSLNNGVAPSYLSEGTTYYSYDGNYFYTDYGTMLSDYQNNVRSQSVNPSSPYYNYYQFLSLKSHTAYSAAELDAIINAKTQASSKLRGLGNSFVTNQNTYNVNAMIMLGIAVNESGWGMSEICQNKNNLFGLDAVDSSPGASASTYATPEECVRQFAGIWMAQQYLNPSNWVYEGECLGNKGVGINVHYASDPYWGERTANLIYALDALGGSKDTIQPEPETPAEPAGDGESEQEVPVTETKVEVKDETTGIAVKGDLADTDTLTVTQVADTEEAYATYVEPVKTQTILGVYDITLSKDLAENEKVTLSFTVDEQYNDQSAVVLHYAKSEEDGNDYLEKYPVTITDGKVEIEVSGFSPYVLALNDPQEEEPGENDTPSNEVPSNEGPVTTPPVTNPPAATPNGGLVLPNPIVETPAGDSNSTPTAEEPTTTTPTTPSTTPTLGSTTGSGSTVNVQVPSSDGQLVNQQTKVTVADKVLADNKTGTVTKKTAAKTGDHATWMIWLMLLLAAGCVAGVKVYRRKHL